MISSIFLDIILILFPIVSYLMYNFFCKIKEKEQRTLLFDISMVSSVYLFLKFGIINKYTVFFVNIPLYFALYKNRKILFFVLSIVISYSLFKLTNVLFVFYLFEFITTYILCNVIKFDKKIIYIGVIFIFHFFIFLFFEYSIYNFFTIIEIIILYLIFLYLEMAFNKIENLLSFYQSLEDSLKEKKLYESLFKITHEIKNPLAVCKGYLDMVDYNNPLKMKKYLSVINQEINRTLEILKDFSDISKCTKIETKKISIKTLLEDVCEEMKLLSRLNNKKNFIFKIEKKEYYVSGDYNKLKQVFINLIKNGFESIIDSGRVNLISIVENDYYVVEISDNGVGIKKEILSKIGKAFFTTKKNGTGLGVCFSKEIIKKHKGKIIYNTKENEGTVVTVKIPIVFNN